MSTQRPKNSELIRDAMSLVRVLSDDPEAIGKADLFLWRCYEHHPAWVKVMSPRAMACAALAPHGVDSPK